MAMPWLCPQGRLGALTSTFRARSPGEHGNSCSRWLLRRCSYPPHSILRASSQNIVENVEVSPAGEPSFDDCYTTLLHNRANDPGLTVGQRSRNRARDCYTNPPHNVRTHIVRRGGRFYYRRRVPGSLTGIVGKREIWRSLGTDSPTVALRRSHQIAAAIERDFELAHGRSGRAVDPRIVSGAVWKSAPERAASAQESPAETPIGATLGEVYDAYMNDPTRDWSPTTRMAYGLHRSLHSTQRIKIWRSADARSSDSISST